MLGIEYTATCNIDKCEFTIGGDTALGTFVVVAMLLYFVFTTAYCFTELIMETVHGSDYLDEHIYFYPLAILIGWPYRILRAALQIRCMSLKWQPQNLKIIKPKNPIGL